MRIVVRLIQWLTLGIAALGSWALYTQSLGVPADRRLTTTIQTMAEAIVHPVAAIALVSLVAGVVARRIRWPATRSAPSRMQPATRTGLPTSPARDSAPLAAPSAVSSPRRDRDRRRIRLEAFLRAQPDVPAFIAELLAEAIRAGASDLHLRPGDTVTHCDLRIRGELGELVRFDSARHDDVVRRLKVLANLVPYVTDQPQDGRFCFETTEGRGRREVWVRVATMPSSRGEKVVLRLAGDARALPLADLGWPAADCRRFEDLLQQPQGMIVLTGPTGCGKTTTLYSALSHLHTAATGRALVSIEDPVEVDLPFVQQTPVDRGRGLGFAEALRAVLRQDPDVLMVGEVRDPETARIAVQASLSGHLLLTTLHAESATGVFPRLIDLGAEPFLAASSTLGCVAQRLLPRLCPECRHPTRWKLADRRRATLLGFPQDATAFSAEGCGACEESGFRGRIGVFEVLQLDPELRRLIAARKPIDEIRDAARQGGHRSLGDAAIQAAAQGEVTLDEALRLAEADKP